MLTDDAKAKERIGPSPSKRAYFASLRRVWEQTFGAAPPSSLSRVFLRRVLLHERQWIFFMLGLALGRQTGKAWS